MRELISSASAKRLPKEKKEQNNLEAASNYESTTQSLTDQIFALTGKTATLEEQLMTMMRIIDHLSQENKELLQNQLEQDHRLRKLEDSTLKVEEETYSQKTRYTLKLTSGDSENKLSLKQDLSSHNILNTTDMSTVESPNTDKSYLQNKGTLKKTQQQTSPFSMTDQSFKSSRGHSDPKKVTDKVINSYRATLKKIHFDDKKVTKKK